MAENREEGELIVPDISFSEEKVADNGIKIKEEYQGTDDESSDDNSPAFKNQLQPNVLMTISGTEIPFSGNTIEPSNAQSYGESSRLNVSLQNDPNRSILIYQKPFECPTCFKRFAMNYHLQVHKRVHEPKSLKCKVCSQIFSSQEEFKEHSKTHKGDKLYPCSLCPKTFTSPSGIKIHTMVHENDRRFHCDRCDKRFLSSSNLRTHYVTHTKEKPYMCDLCHKGFSQLGSLKSHKLLHEKPSRYDCGICGKMFVREYNMITHIQTAHPERG